MVENVDPFPLPKPKTPRDIDPVCGRSVDKTTATQKTKHEGKEYVFCSPSCLRLFQQEPHRYFEKTI